MSSDGRQGVFQADVALQSASSSRTAQVEPRNPRSDGHRDDGGGELVSDGIVTWRRRLPDVSELGRTSPTVDYQHQHAHYRPVSRHLDDARKMSIPAVGRRDRRDAFAQQKSFSYEAACVGRRLPPTPNELAAAVRARRDPRGTGAWTAVQPVDRRRGMLMQAKKSYAR